MARAITEQPETKLTANAARISFSWQDSPSIKHLLDVISSIIAQEYIQIAKQNKDVFVIASGASRPRNDKGGPK